MAVRTRVALAYAAIMALVLTGGSLFLLTRLRVDLRSAIDDGLRSRAAVIVRDVNEEFGDVGTHEGVIDESEVVAQILDARGRVLESTDAVGPAPLISAQRARGLRGEMSFEANIPVRGDTDPGRLFVTRTRNGSIVVVGTSTEDAHEALAALTRLLLLGVPGVLALTTAAVWALAGVALRPVERLRAEAQALAFGIDGRRLPVPQTNDEIQGLAETLNGMLERLEQALERERRFVDDASHELRTPLAVLKTQLELTLRKARTVDELTAAVRSATEEVESLATLAENLLILARADRGMLPTRRTRLNVTELTEHVCAGFEPRAAELGITLRAEGRGPVWSNADPLLLRQALSNVIQNALTHTPRGGAVTVTASTHDGELHLVVNDSGPGFDSELLPHAFDPFTQADGARSRSSGTGLGLAIVRAIVQAHGGWVSASNRDGEGASVAIGIP